MCIDINKLNKVFAPKKSWKIISTINNIQYVSNGICIWLFHDEKPFTDCFEFWHEPKDNSIKPNLELMAKVHTEKYFSTYNYEKAYSHEIGYTFTKDITGKNSKKIIKTKSFLLSNAKGKTVINADYYNTCVLPLSQFYISDSEDSYNHSVFVFDRKTGKLSVIIMPMIISDYSYFKKYDECHIDKK